MNEYLFGALLGAAALGIFLLFRAVRRKRREHFYYEMVLMAAAPEEAKELYENSIRTLISQLIDPIGSGLSQSDAAKCLELAVFAKDRMHQLEGKEHGPAFRLKERPEILTAAKQIADREFEARAR